MIFKKCLAQFSRRRIIIVVAELVEPDGYAVGHALGQGSMGVVYAARHVRTGQPVAIKWLTTTAAEKRTSALQRFELEASLTNQIDSPHIVRVIELGHHRDGLPYIVMERFEGEDVQALLDRTGPLAPDAALRIAAQTCVGLEDAHRAGIVHRDIKPSNLFLAQMDDGTITVKILDFGIAKIRAGHPDAKSAGKSRTTVGRVMGSPYFLSPEQLHGRPDIDQQADIFSLGITLYTMLVGTVPFPNVKNFVKFLLQAASTPPKPVHDAAPWVQPEISAIVEHATRIERETRYTTARMMHDAIRKILPGNTHLCQDMLVGIKG
jgi:serine/threonine-protein kinase